ncbi:hypothetical protein C8F01DRAFT_1044722 [Mycena amicta]|nr:hypothetical protein C8F01DRAFT_1044722 [Mycena amicta]
MPLAADNQVEFGRRRRDSRSDSSRESSPIRRPQRSFTPTSDDEIDTSKLVAGAHDESPPPEGGPLIRASLAFGGAFVKPSLNTYAPVVVKKPRLTFLPGQAVSIPPKVRKKRQPRFPGHTNRFRVDSTYDPTPPPNKPALALGNGPYTSIYRMATPADASTSRKKPASEKATSKSKAKASIRAPKRQQHQFSVEPELSPEEEEVLHRSTPGDKTQALVTSSNAPRNLQPPSKLAKDAPRLVTLLIEDVRGESPDSLLAEVRVPLRDSENVKEHGYWAYAEDICSTLQNSAARIDGPAKVSTWRGKYRQVILRVNEYNDDNWVQGHIVVKPDRTLEVRVEKDGHPLRPAEIRTSQKRRHSSSEDSDHRDRRRHHHTASALASPSNNFSHSRHDDDQEMEIEDENDDQHAIDEPQGSSFTAMEDEDDGEAVLKRITEEVNDILSTESDWEQFFRSLGRAHLSGVISCYTIVQRFVDKWVGKRTPSGALIEPSHIAAALSIEDVEEDGNKYMERCAETMKLLALYGPSGKRSEDPEVAAMIQNTEPPGYGNKPELVLLRRLRGIDKQWRDAHP